MPELPEISLYLDAFRRRIEGAPLRAVRLRSPSLLKTWDPPLPAVEGGRVTGLSRLGKRVVWAVEPDLFLVFHLMVTGRFQWRAPGAPVPRKVGHAAFDFDDGTVLLTEQGSKKRASLHLVRGREALEALDPGGVEPLEVDEAGFREALLRENHTLKRALTDPRIFSGIGNAHSDEILLRARLSPLQRTANLSAEEVGRLHGATQASLREWMERLRAETGSDFPSRVTAFHPEMTAHGRYGEPCPRCGEPIQRIRYAGRETNYCPTCQTGGKLLADRALSRILGDDWPRSVEELESLRREHRGGAGPSVSP